VALIAGVIPRIVNAIIAVRDKVLDILNYVLVLTKVACLDFFYVM